MSAEMPRPRDYRDLVVWKKGMELARHVYEITKTFPEGEKFGLVSQMRRAAVSVPSIIAEGQARNTTGEFIPFLSHAVGSVSELDTQLILCVELGFSSQSKTQPARELILELRKMLTTLRKKLSSGP